MHFQIYILHHFNIFQVKNLDTVEVTVTHMISNYVMLHMG